MKKDSIRKNLAKFFVRDVNLEKESFLFLFLSLFSIVLIIEVLLLRYVTILDVRIGYEIEIIAVLFIIALSFLLAGIFVDSVMDKTQLHNITFLICIIGLFMILFTDTILMYIGLGLILLTLPLLIIIWFTTLVHETDILNRGRITALLIISCFLFAMIGVLFAFFDFMFIVFPFFEAFLLILIVRGSKNYRYIETEERLTTNRKFLKIIFEKRFFSYSFSFTVLSLILGDFVARFGLTIDIFVFSIVSFFYLIGAGCFFDNVGRKNTLVIGILVLSFFLIVSSGFVESDTIIGIPKRIHLSFHYAFSILPLLLSVFIISGDFSTERGNLKYRGRINGLYMAIMFLGVMIGFLLYRIVNGLYATVPELRDIIPDFPNHLHNYMLVILLVWFTFIEESLFSKEKNWASTIKKLYVFSTHGICVYYHDFKKENGPKKELTQECTDDPRMDEDLISGGLSGILTIINEITQSKKQLRKIAKKENNLLFAHGKYHIVALIASKDLPILLKKLDGFSSDFESRYIKELKDFTGLVQPFQNTKYLVKRYFHQEYSFFIY